MKKVGPAIRRVPEEGAAGENSFCWELTMAGISFGAKAESDWMVAGWAFRQVLDDLERYVFGRRTGRRRTERR